jgi:Uma2 family endonuclease
MAQPQKQFYTPQEYLALEEAAAYKSEYYDGQIYMMAGGSETHALICINFASELRLALKGKTCRTYGSDLKVEVKGGEAYTYPDVAVICGKPEFVKNRTDTITNPVVVIEVLSASTGQYDRTAKFELYQALPSMQHYVLVDQKRIYVGCYEKLENDTWLLHIYRNLQDTLKLAALGVEIKLAEIYADVDFAEVKPASNT